MFTTSMTADAFFIQYGFYFRIETNSMLVDYKITG